MTTNTSWRMRHAKKKHAKLLGETHSRDGSIQPCDSGAENRLQPEESLNEPVADFVQSLLAVFHGAIPMDSDTAGALFLKALPFQRLAELLFDGLTFCEERVESLLVEDPVLAIDVNLGAHRVVAGEVCGKLETRSTA